MRLWSQFRPLCCVHLHELSWCHKLYESETVDIKDQNKHQPLFATDLSLTARITRDCTTLRHVLTDRAGAVTNHTLACKALLVYSLHWDTDERCETWAETSICRLFDVNLLRVQEVTLYIYEISTVVALLTVLAGGVDGGEVTPRMCWSYCLNHTTLTTKRQVTNFVLFLRNGNQHESKFQQF